MTIGRPTDSKKDVVIRARIDEKTNQKLEKCIEIMKSSKSEIIREGILKIYDELTGNEVRP